MRGAVSTSFAAVLAATGLAVGATLLLAPPGQAQRPLAGINCRLNPTEAASAFRLPLQGGGWRITNPFGNTVTNKTIPGLPAGVWRHTGVDYLLRGSSGASQRQTVYAAGSGVVVFSTKSEANPLPRRGGLVIVKHIAPAERRFRIPALQTRGVVYPAFESNQVFTYYLHLDPNQITVVKGSQVKLGEPVGKLYATSGAFTYKPHLHFEVWRACGAHDPNGYDRQGAEFERSVRNLLVDPVSFLASASLSAPPPPAPPTDLIHFKPVDERGDGCVGIGETCWYENVPIVAGEALAKSVVLGTPRGPGTQVRVSFDIGGKYRRLTAKVAALSNVGDCIEGPWTFSMSFRLFGDGRDLYRSGPLTPGQPAQLISIDISSVKRITLLNIVEPSNPCGYTYGVWGNPVVSG